MADKMISDSPDWFNPDIPDENRVAAIELDFEETLGKDERFLTADPVTQQEYRQAHQQLVEEAARNSEYNPSNQKDASKQKTADRSGYLENTLTKVFDAHKDLIARTKFAADALNPDGTFNSNFAKNASKYLQKRNEHIVTQEDKKLAVAVGKLQKGIEKDGVWNDTKHWGEFLFKDLPQNLGGIGHVAAESASSITAMMMGAWGGGKVGVLGGGVAGSVAGPAGAAAGAAIGATVGAATGMFATGTADAATDKLMEQLESRLVKAGIAPTESGIQMFLNQNPGVIKEMQKTALTYGSVLGLVDIATGGFFSKVATLPTRAARKTAMRSMDDVARAAIEEAAKAEGKTVQEMTKRVIDGRARELLKGNSLQLPGGEIIKGRSFKQKLAGKGTSLGGEVLSEPLSEAAATAAIGEEVTATDLVYETLGGIGAGPYGAAVNTAVFGSKLAANKTGEFTKKILSSTPESRAALKEQEAAIQQAKQQSQSRNDINFKKDLVDLEATDVRIDEWANAAGAKYDPIKAVTALAKFTDTESADKAEAVYKNLREEFIAIADQMEAMAAKAESGEKAAPQEVALYEKLYQQSKIKGEVPKQAYKQISIIRTRVAEEAKTKEIAPLDPVTATPEQVVDNITESFGSHGNENAVASDAEKIDRLLGRKDLSKTDRTLLSAMKEAAEARAAVNSNSKTMQEVSNDIYHGHSGSEYKGIDAYKAGIANYLNKNVNNIEAATTQLEGLKKFHAAHQEKATKLAEAFEEAQSSGLTLRVKAGSKSYNVHKNSGSLIMATQAEAIALQKEVAAAESLFAARAAQTQAKVAPVAKAPVKGKSAPSVEAPQLRRVADMEIEDYQNDLREAGVQAESPQWQKLVNKQRNSILSRAIDPLSGYQTRAEFGVALPQIWKRHKEGKVPITYTEFDVTNLGGLNEHLGEKKADEILAAIYKIVNDTFLEHGIDDVQMFRNGGDEGQGISSKSKKMHEAAIAEAEKKVAIYVKKNGLDKVPGKTVAGQPKNTTPIGTGIYYGTESFGDWDSWEDAVNSAKNAVNAAKNKRKGAIHGRTGTKGSGDATSAGQSKGATEGSRQAENRTGEETQETAEVKADKETKVSTKAENVAKVTDENTAPDYKDPGDMDVKFTGVDGELVTRPYNEAFAEINNEIEEAKKVLDCVKTK